MRQDLALGDLAPARGSALLFATNVVAIILGAAVSLYASGVRGKRGAGSHQKWVSYAFLVLLLGTVALAFPLGSGLRSQLTGGIPKKLPDLVEQQLEEHPGVRLLEITRRREDGQRILVIELAAPRPVSAELVRDLASVARDELGEGELVVRVGTRLSTEVR